MQELRKFILGEVNEVERQAIEERLMTEDAYFEELTILEEEILQDYVNEKLSADEKKGFERHFLCTEENRQKLKFARAMNKIAEEQQPTQKKQNFFSSLLAFFMSPIPALGAILIVGGLIGLFVWKKSNSQSEILVALIKYQENERLTKGRMADFPYAPRIEGIRGENDKNKDQFRKAENLAIDAVKDQTAENLHERGRVYLAERNFDEAIKLLKLAIEKNPNIAKIHNDLGVAYIEKGISNKNENIESEKSNNKINENKIYSDFFDNATNEFGKAIELDNLLLEAYFNRALSLELNNLTYQAKEEWQNYLKSDATSKWAEEAREHLDKLEENKPVSKKKEEILKEFFEAKKINDVEKSWEILSKNREITEGKLIPQQLAFLFIDSKINKDKDKVEESLEALNYVAKLEEVKSGDLFWRDISNYYSEISDEKINILSQAKNNLTEGFEKYLNSDFKEATVKFEKSAIFFQKADNQLQMQISNSYIALCLGYSENKSNEIDEKRLKIINQVLDYSQNQHYEWLELLGLKIKSTIQIEKTQYYNAIKNSEKAYLIAKKIESLFDEQSSLDMLTSIYSKVGDKKNAIKYFQLYWSKINDSNSSLESKWEAYFTKIDLLFSVNNLNLAKLLVKEEVLIAEQIGDARIISTSQTQAGIIFAKSNSIEEARFFLQKSKENAEKLPESSFQRSLAAYSLLKLADLEETVGNYDESARLYNECLEIGKTPYFELEIQKGRLRSFLAEGNNEALEEQIPLTVKIAEENRQNILEEEEQNGFLHNEISIFETAIEWEFNRGNYEKSYNYNEEASARSLLDILENSKNLTKNKDEINVIPNKPLELYHIQNNIPENTQLLQYTVLKNKILIWLIEKNNFVVKEVPISSEELSNKIEKFIHLTLSNKEEISDENYQISKELFSILLQPIYEKLDKNKHICIIPNKKLFFLPFSALLTENGKFFLEEFQLSYSPSANIFILCTKNAEGKNSNINEKVLSIGNPSFDSSIFSELSNLTSAVGEAKTISSFYDDSKPLIGKDATKTAFQQSIGKANILHFAGHYLVNPEDPLFSGLLFAKDGEDVNKGILTNKELYQENISQVKLVVLSSCETGIESFLNGEGMIGVSRIFLALGVPVVVASQWEIDSERTAIIMTDLHRIRREQKLPTATALRQAQLARLKDKKFNTPYYWAGFALYGGYSQF